MEKVYWTTKDGRKLDVDEIDIEHLRNIVKYLIRKQEDYEDRMDYGDYQDTF